MPKGKYINWDSNVDTQKIIKEYLSGISATKISKKYRYGWDSIYLLLKKENIWQGKRDSYNRKYICNFSYFHNIDSEKKAYWIGFIAADGHVKDNSLVIKLQDRDKCLLEAFKKDTNSNYPIQTYPWKNKAYVVIKFTHKKIVQDLYKYDIKPRKTWSIRVPTCIHDKYLRHYLRGVFDGDGCWRIDSIRGRIGFSIAGGYKPFLEDLQHILIKNVGLNKTKISETKKHTFDLCYSGRRQLKRIFDYIYCGATRCLERKRKRASSFFDNYKK